MHSTKVVPLPGADSPAGATVIAFPRELIIEPSLAELSIASLLIEVHQRAKAATSTWQREKWSAQLEGFLTSLSIVLAGECGDTQLSIRQSLVETLAHGCDDADDLIARGRSPHEPVIA